VLLALFIKSLGIVCTVKEVKGYLIVHTINTVTIGSLINLITIDSPRASVTLPLQYQVVLQCDGVDLIPRVGISSIIRVKKTMEAKETGVPPALRRNAKRIKCFKNTKRTKYISIISVVIFLAILALIISLAVILPRRTKLPTSFASTVLVPLYIYPIDGAWEPLYEM
jgi:hypothetical protein